MRGFLFLLNYCYQNYMKQVNFLNIGKNLPTLFFLENFKFQEFQ